MPAARGYAPLSPIAVRTARAGIPSQSQGMDIATAGLRGHHRRMRTVRGLLSLFMCCRAAQGIAADAPAPAQRPLLQPPVVDNPSPITDRFAIRLVYFRPSVSTTVRYDDSTGNPGTTFSGEDTIGLQDRRNQGWIDLMFRMTPRHRIEAQFYQLKRSGEVTLVQALRFGNNTFQPADGPIQSSMDLRQLNLGYTYSVVQQSRLEIGVGLGVHLAQIEGSLAAPAVFKREHLDSAGPYPTLGGELTWLITRRFSANATAHFLTFSANDVNGHSLAWNADVQFRAWPNLALGLGYAGTLYRIDSIDQDFFRGYLKLRYQGPQFFVRASL